MTPELTALREHLVATRIAGDVATPRAENIRNAGRMVEGRARYDFGSPSWGERWNVMPVFDARANSLAATTNASDIRS